MEVFSKNLSVFDLDEHGYIAHKNGDMVINSFIQEDSEEEVESISKASEMPFFNNKENTYACCESTLPEATIVIATAELFIAPCYNCERWTSWPRIQQTMEVGE